MNTLFSLAVPLVAGGIGTAGMLSTGFKSALLLGIDSAIEGAAYPIMNTNTFHVPHLGTKILMGMISGAVAGFASGVPAGFGLRANSYAKTLGWFTLRGLQMEAMRTGMYALTMEAAGIGYTQNNYEIGTQILANGALIGIEGMGFRFANTLLDGAVSFRSMSRGYGLFSLAGSIMQIGSPFVDARISKIFKVNNPRKS